MAKITNFAYSANLFEMKKIFVFMSALMLASGAVAQVPYWKDLDVYSVNAETERTELIFWDNEQDAVAADFQQSGAYMSLNGTWNFKYADTEAQIPQQ